MHAHWIMSLCYRNAGQCRTGLIGLIIETLSALGRQATQLNPATQSVMVLLGPFSCGRQFHNLSYATFIRPLFGRELACNIAPCAAYQSRLARIIMKMGVPIRTPAMENNGHRSARSMECQKHILRCHHSSNCASRPRECRKWAETAPRQSDWQKPPKPRIQSGLQEHSCL